MDNEIMNIQKFQESITAELDSIKNRVRNLIGKNHWGEEGRYKEVILKNVLRRFLPKNLSVGTGFILGKGDKCSKQLDIIIYDNTIPILFSEGDFIVTTASNVKGIIEVKTRIDKKNNLEKAVKQLEDAIKNFYSDLNEIFIGIFSFEYNNIDPNDISKVMKESEKMINHISLGTDYFIRFWKKDEGENLRPKINSEWDFYNIYLIKELSFSYFISNLINIASDYKLSDRNWFLFPVKDTKESRRIDTIYLDN